MKPEEVIKYLEMVRPAENYSHTYSVSVGNIRHFGPGSQLNKDVSKAIDLAIQAIGKQIPKKPVLIPHWSPSKKDYKCPVCSGDVNRQWEYEHYDDRMIGEEQYEHCPDCGQRIDWSVEE